MQQEDKEKNIHLNVPVHNRTHCTFILTPIAQVWVYWTPERELFFQKCLQKLCECLDFWFNTTHTMEVIGKHKVKEVETFLCSLGNIMDTSVTTQGLLESIYWKAGLGQKWRNQFKLLSLSQGWIDGFCLYMFQSLTVLSLPLQNNYFTPNILLRMKAQLSKCSYLQNISLFIDE